MESNALGKISLFTLIKTGCELENCKNQMNIYSTMKETLFFNFLLALKVRLGTELTKFEIQYYPIMHVPTKPQLFCHASVLMRIDKL